jgi:hypothetical protein
MSDAEDPQVVTRKLLPASQLLTLVHIAAQAFQREADRLLRPARILVTSCSLSYVSSLTLISRRSYPDERGAQHATTWPRERLSQPRAANLE